jgi:transcriptional regulator with XRE-family HTH domain
MRPKKSASGPKTDSGRQEVAALTATPMAMSERQRRVQMTFAARVQFFRHLRQMKGAELAAAAGISKAMYSQIESAVRVPSLAVIGNLAAALGVPIGDLFGGDAPNFEPIHTPAGQGQVASLPEDPRAQFEWIGGAELGPVRVSAFIIGNVLKRFEGRSSDQFDGLWIEHVLAGEVVVEVGEREYHLEAGDTFTYRAEVPVRLIRCSDDCRVLSMSTRLL